VDPDLHREDVAVDRECERRRGVAETLSDDVGRYSGLQQQRGVGVVGWDRAVVPAFQPVRFLGPSAEPDVRVPSHPALHRLVSLGYAIDLDAHGVVSVICPRYRA
jgi:hypothetical protein